MKEKPRAAAHPRLEHPAAARTIWSRAAGQGSQRSAGRRPSRAHRPAGRSPARSACASRRSHRARSRARGRPPKRCRPWRSTAGLRRTAVFDQMLAQAYPNGRPAELGQAARGREDGSSTRSRELRAHERVEGSAQLEVDRSARPRDIASASARGRRARHRCQQGARRAQGGARGQSLRSTLEADRHRKKRRRQPARNLASGKGARDFVEPYAELAAAYRAAAETIDEWHAPRTAAAGQSERGPKPSAARSTDLEFQIKELRAALAKHEETLRKEQSS